MTSKRASVIQELRNRIEDLDPNREFTDSYLSRWLQARYWIVSDAETMLRDHVKWRRENAVDSILEQHKKSEFISTYFPGGFCGKDRQDRPLYIAPCGRFDTYNFIKCVPRSTLIRDRIFVLEDIVHRVLPQSSRDAHRPVEQLCVLVDLQGLNRSHISVSWMNYMRDVVTMMETNYPEILGTCYIVNAPYLFSVLFTFLRAVLSKATQEKIYVLKSDYREALLEHIDPKFLPQVYGGSMVDPNGDPRCSSLICWGGPIPDSCMRKFSFQLTSDDAVSPVPSNQYLEASISRGSLQDVFIGFLSDGTRLTCSLACESCDIGVGLYCKIMVAEGTACQSDPGHDPDPAGLKKLLEDVALSELVPVKRFSKSTRPIHATFTVPFAAIYYLRLDNSYSWVRSKRVRYAFRTE